MCNNIYPRQYSLHNALRYLVLGLNSLLLSLPSMGARWRCRLWLQRMTKGLYQLKVVYIAGDPAKHVQSQYSECLKCKMYERSSRNHVRSKNFYFHSAVDGLVHFLTTLREILLHCTLEISKYFPFFNCSALFCREI